MKLHLEGRDQENRIRSCNRVGEGYRIQVGKITFSSSIIVTPGQVFEWKAREVSELSEKDFAGLPAPQPEVVILGTGSRIVFPEPAVYAPLIRSGVGLEVMDTPAACRTFNILLSDSRNTTALLIA